MAPHAANAQTSPMRLEDDIGVCKSLLHGRHLLSVSVSGESLSATEVRAAQFLLNASMQIRPTHPLPKFPSESRFHDSSGLVASCPLESRFHDSLGLPASCPSESRFHDSSGLPESSSFCGYFLLPNLQGFWVGG
eukprot:10053581-Karenia_brevis.AAC.1